MGSPTCEALPPSAPIIEGMSSTITHAGEGVHLSILARKICAQSEQFHTLVVQVQGGGSWQIEADKLAALSETVPDDPLATRYRLFLEPDQLPQHDSTISVFVSSNLDGATAASSLRWAGSQVETEVPQRLFVLSIGIDEPDKDIQYADEDARRFSEFWKRHAQPSYEKNPYIKTLTNGAATREAILGELLNIKKVATRNTDTVIFFIAGHGINENNQFYVKTMAARQQNTGLDEYFYWLKGDEIVDALTAIKAGRKFLFADVCHSGLLRDELPVRARGDIHQFYRKITTDDPTTVVFTASSSFGYAFENEKRWGGGAFTYATLQGLCGAALRPESEGKVMVLDLHVYLSDYFDKDIDIAKRQTPEVIISTDSETPWRTGLVVPTGSKKCPY